MEANSKTNIPQVGTAAGIPCGESYTEPSSVSLTVSGGGNYRSTQEDDILDKEKGKNKQEDLDTEEKRRNEQAGRIGCLSETETLSDGWPNTEDGTNPFTRRGNVQRSPIKPASAVGPTGLTIFGRARSGSLPTIHNSEGLRSIQLRIGTIGGKRQRDADEYEDRKYDDMIALCTELSKIANNLCRLVGENTNTKVEIKNGVKHLKNRLDGLNRKIKDRCAHSSEQTIHNHPKTRARVVNENYQNSSTQTDKYTQSTLTATRDQSTQTTSFTKGQSTQTETDKEGVPQLHTELRAMIDEGINFNGLAEIIENVWPEEVYKAVKIQRANPMTLDKNWDIAVLAEPRKEGNNEKAKGIRKLLERVYPEAMELLDDGELGKVEFTVSTNKSSKSGV